MTGLSSPANFRPGPVAMRPAVHAAFRRDPASHRGAPFLRRSRELSRVLCELTGAAHATLCMGSGTLANDIVGALLARLGPGGVVAVNGEFGERLADAARRFGLRPHVVSSAWGAPLDYDELEAALDIATHEGAPAWLWAVHCETSTGVLNDLPRLSAIAVRAGARLAIDAISSVGTTAVDLGVADYATATSGKALGSYAGVGIVLHRERPEPCDRTPRYLDLGFALAHDGVPFTQTSNLVDALHAAVSGVDWDARYARIARAGSALRHAMRAAGFAPLVADAIASPAVLTVALPADVRARTVGERLADTGVLLSYESGYLEQRNWIQVCLMGQWEDTALEALPGALRRAVDETRSGRPAHDTLRPADAALSLPVLR